MTLGLTLYKSLTRLLGLFSGMVLSRRVRAGKENPARLNERRARQSPARPAERVVWLHGASVGESLILLELGKRLMAEAPDIHLLFTSQTQTSAELMANQLPPRAVHQMAPLDTPGGAKRFIRHWQPALGVFAEGEIWPNLIRRAKKNGVRLALVNARMTEKSLKGWARWPRTADKVLGSFDLVLAANDQTANGLNALLGSVAFAPGNLKSALPPPDGNAAEMKRLHAGFLSDRTCWLAASTHPGEEALILDAREAAHNRPALVIAPRHPERGDAIENLIAARGLTCSRRSRRDSISTDTDVLLADTLGEMGLWYRLADAIYLGGGHAKGVGGHNPLEPLKLGKTVITGPDVFNFTDMMAKLAEMKALRFAETASDVARLAAEPIEPSSPALSDWLKQSDIPMQTTIDALLKLLEARA